MAGVRNQEEANCRAKKQIADAGLAGRLAAEALELALETFEFVGTNRLRRFNELAQLGFAGCAGKHRNI